MMPFENTLPVGLHVVRVQAPEVAGPLHEVVVLADLDTVRILQITLRGAVLARHAASTPLTLQAVHGCARVVVEDIDVHVGEGTLVVLDVGTPHAVHPEGAGPVVLLVHQHKLTQHARIDPTALASSRLPGHEPGPDVMTP
jgi:hypothetical protein